MTTRIAALVLATAALCAGSVLAQSRPQAPAPRTGAPAPPPAVGTVPAGQGQTRGTVHGGVGTFEGENALVQTGPQAPAPRAGVLPPPPAVGTVPAGQGQGQTRGTEGGGRTTTDPRVQTTNSIGRSSLSQADSAAAANSIGGTGGGRYTFPGVRVVDNSETDTAAAAPGATHDIESAGGVNQTGGTRSGTPPLQPAPVRSPAPAPGIPR